MGSEPFARVLLKLMRSSFEGFCYAPKGEKAFREDLKKVKEAFPKARHVLYCYRTREEDRSIKEGMSENGEPVKAMRKALYELRAEDLLLAVIIVRTFGGKELGAARLEKTFLDCFHRAVESFRKEEGAWK